MPTIQRRRATAALVLLASVAAGCGGKASPPQSGRRSTPSSSTATRMPDVTSAVDTGPVLLDGHAVIRPEAVGPLHVGAWRRAAMSFVYAMTSFSGANDAEITPVHGVGKDTVTVVIVNDTVSQLQVLRPGARTVDGLQVGTPLATVRALPGAQIGHDGSATTVRLPHDCGILFSTADSSAHSGAKRKEDVLPFPPDSAVIRTIIVGKCTRA